MGKMILVGAEGTIGRAVADLLGADHDLIRVGHSSGDMTVDLGSKASIDTLFGRIGGFDALVSAAGPSRFGKVDEAGDADFRESIHYKLMGQVNLVRVGLQSVADNGSFTLTSGLLAREPWPGTAPTAMVNAGLEGFVRAAALDAGRGIRINVVSPILVTETAEQMGMDTAGTMSAVQTAAAYRIAVEGEMTGKVIDVRDIS